MSGHSSDIPAGARDNEEHHGSHSTAIGPVLASARPNRIRGLLSRFVLVELRPDGEWDPTYRLAGTEFERIAGRSLTGRHVADLFDTDAYKRIERVLADTAADAVPRYQHARLLFPERDFVLVQRLFLPWSMAGDTADFIGGIMVDMEGTGRLPAP